MVCRNCLFNRHRSFLCVIEELFSNFGFGVIFKISFCATIRFIYFVEDSDFVVSEFHEGAVEVKVGSFGVCFYTYGVHQLSDLYVHVCMIAHVLLCILLISPIPVIDLQGYESPIWMLKLVLIVPMALLVAIYSRKKMLDIKPTPSHQRDAIGDIEVILSTLL